MIRYALRCHEGHSFDSWFRSAGAFEALREGGHLNCPHCGSARVDKALMAPQVRPARRAEAARATAPEDAAPPASAAAPPRPPAPGPSSPGPSSPGPSSPGPLSAPATEREAALAELRRRIEERSEYVGLEFAAEARRMHSGDAPERSIHGEARLEDARALIAEGVPVAPLPFLPARKAN